MTVRMPFRTLSESSDLTLVKASNITADSDRPIPGDSVRVRK